MLSRNRQASRNCQSRIIGGEWRSRRFQFADLPALRPTPDRLRETLFNWLGADIRSRRCLDLFAGSGALGLEALSRGAASTTFVDSESEVIRCINHAISQFQCQTRAVAVRDDTLRYLSSASDSWDIVFIDPPFAAGALPAVLNSLMQNQLLSPAALVFIEYANKLPAPEISPRWTELRSSKVGASTGSLLSANG